MSEKKPLKILGKDYVWGPDVDFDKEVFLDKNGERYTNARIDAMVKEIEEFGPYVGRPSLTAPAVHSPEIKARVPAPLKEKLDAAAQARGETPSALIRQAVEEFLAKTTTSK